MLGESISRNSILLDVFAVVTTLLISGTYLLTKDKIALEQRKAEEKALLEIVPQQRHDNSMLDDKIAVGRDTNALGLKTDKHIYLAKTIAMFAHYFLRNLLDLCPSNNSE